MRDIITKLEELNVEQEQINEGLADMAHEAEKDHEVQMARSDCYKSAKYAVAIHKMLKDVSEMEGIDGWVAAKITKAADYLGSVKHYMEGEAMQDVELAVVPVAGDMTDAMTMPQESVEEAQIDEDMSAMANSRDVVERTYGQIMQGKRGVQPDQSEVGDYIPKDMTPEQIMELIDMLEPQGYDKEFLLKDLADMMQEDADVIGDIIGKLAQGKAGAKGGKDVIGDIIAKLPKDKPETGSKPAISAVTQQKAANKMALPTSRPERPRSMANDTTRDFSKNESKFSEWSKK
jgi:hypothetical protein